MLRRLPTLLLALSLGVCARAAAQAPGAVASEQEEYLRWLQLGGLVPLHQWTARPFSTRDIAGLRPPTAGHPWASRLVPEPTAQALRVRLLPLENRTSLNTGFPWGFNDGAVWQGRGITTAVRGGITAAWGPLSLTLLPTAFAAQNAGFPLEGNGRTGNALFAHGYDPRRVDAPQRFGTTVYRGLDPGQSTLRLDLPVVTLGVSTANEWWGPAVSQPILLGNNAAGFPHLFLGSSEPVDLWFARASGRLIWGDLRQSAFSPAAAADARRLASGIVGVLEPRGTSGLEFGGGRFFQEQWPARGLSWSSLKRPLSALLRSARITDPNNPASDPPNQTASLWVRWAAPSAGVEFYGEYGKDDDNWDLRDYIGEPENTGGYVLGLRKVWGMSERGFWSADIEHLDMRQSQWTTGRPGGGVFYRHGPNLTQGHTERGQILGSAFGIGGVASSLALNRYAPNGRWRLTWGRYLMQDARNVLNVLAGRVQRVTAYDPDGFDVIHALGAEIVRFRGPFTFSGGVTAMYEFNRYLRGDAANLHAWVGASWDPAPGRRPGFPEREADDLREAGAVPSGARESRSPDATPATGWFALDVSGPESERARLDQTLGASGTDGFLLRSPSSLERDVRFPLPASRFPAIRLLAPDVRFVHNSAIPFSLNDGALWAGAGGNVIVTAGVRAEWGPVRLTVAPQLAGSANSPFPMPDPRFYPIPLPAGRDSLASPWHIRPGSIDLPVRFGTSGFTRVYPGQSTLAVGGGAFETGVSTENEWWGPGVRNAIVLSDNAPGFPHFFIRTGRPLRTAAGTVEGRWLVGGLSESRYFDRDPSNDRRSLSALGLSWAPRWVPGLTVGVARAVYAPASGWGAVAADFFNAAVVYPGRPNDRAASDSTPRPGPDQLYSWFGRWVLPGAGLEIYGEFAKTELPSSFRDFLVSPGHTLGYTLGLQWARALAGAAALPAIRLQAEHTWLEKSATFRQKPIGTYYASPAVIQGYTNQGQVLGAAIGPGASSHWLAMDYVDRHWEAGVFGGRIRWDNDAMYTVNLVSPYLSYWCMHDVSLFGGVRGGYRGPLGTVAASVTTGTRYDIWFRNTFVCGKDFKPGYATDVRNTTLELRYTLPVASFGRRRAS